MSNTRENRIQRESSPPGEHAPPDVARAGSRIPLSVNLHLTHECNYRCRFCYFSKLGHFASLRPDDEPTLPLNEQFRLQQLLAEAGVDRITYAGGEPTLYDRPEDLALHWHDLHGGAQPRAIRNGPAAWYHRSSQTGLEELCSGSSP